MKKTLLASMVLGLLLLSGPIFAEETAQQQTETRPTVTTLIAPKLQKIPSTDQIQNYREVRMVGDTLMGFLKVQPVSSSTLQKERQLKERRIKEQKMKEQRMKEQKMKEQKAKERISTSTMERISHPNEIAQFEKVQKIGDALWGIRRKVVAQKPVLVKPQAVQCVKDAIDKKDAALKTARSSQSQTVLTAIDARNACQKAALDKTVANEQFEANRACASVFQRTVAAGNEATEKVRNALWSVFNTDLKSCSALQRATSSEQSLIENIKIDDGGSAI